MAWGPIWSVLYREDYVSFGPYGRRVYGLLLGAPQRSVVSYLTTDVYAYGNDCEHSSSKTSEVKLFCKMKIEILCFKRNLRATIYIRKSGSGNMLQKQWELDF